MQSALEQNYRPVTAGHDAQSILSRYRPLIEAEMKRALERPPDSLLYEIIRYHLGWTEEAVAARGKLIRPTLCLLSCRAVGGEAEVAAPAAAAIEFVHAFTLLHDDIADQDGMRRGRPTAWKRWGVGQALTAGDALYALANLALSRLDCSRLPADLRAAAQRDLNEAVLALCEGQQLDLSYEGRTDLDYPGYLRMVSLKTGALFRAAVAIGARIGGADRGALEALADFGSALGLVFQVRDDILGLWGDPRELGKPVGGDLVRRKRSLPLVLALSSTEPALRQKALDGIAERLAVEQSTAGLAEALEADGTRDLCERTARALLVAALEHLDRAEQHPVDTRDLRALAIYLAQRTR